MDSITQALLGATIAEAGFRRRLGPRAVVAGAAFGLLPDLDIVSAAFGDWASLVHHRGVSHSLLFAPLLAYPLGWLAWRWGRRRGALRSWAWLAFWAIWTHPLLDVCTSYGTQLLAPFDRTRFAIDAVAIIDPVYSGLLLSSLLIAWVWRRAPQVGAVVASVALASTTAYLGLGLALSSRAAQAAHSALPEGFAPVELRALPTFGNLITWRIVARDAVGTLQVGHVSLRSGAPPPQFVELKRPRDPRLDAALATEGGRILTWFSMDMWSASIHENPDGSATVHLDDQRYGSLVEPARTLWGARAHFDPRGELTDVQWDRSGRKNFDMRAEWNQLVSSVFGP